jgi:CDP-glycerol glycerophosphotransferase
VAREFALAELTTKVVVSSDHLPDLGQGVRSVVEGSAEFYDLLATSRCIVADGWLPNWFRRAPGQTVVQIGLSTPVRRIGLDVPDQTPRQRRMATALVKGAQEWTHLAVTSHFAGRIYRRALSFDGALLEVGSLIGQRLQQLQQQRSATNNHRAVALYAPAAREAEYAPGMNKFDLQLDLAALAADFGHELRLLLRKPPGAIDPVPPDLEWFATDVSEHPDVAQLLAVSDTLITDYEPLAVDAMRAGVPLILFPYDHEDEVSRHGAPYLDLRAQFEGGFAETVDGLYGWLGNVGRAVPTSHAPEVVAALCPWDDGAAARRLLDALLEVWALVCEASADSSRRTST